uniref:Genome polyprotein n=1 Tax=Bean yellow mosaic virus TaxID=12197 RepID=A0A4P8D469_BYMV|nr:polyprotein [Bean yellow mosaic virus]
MTTISIGTIQVTLKENASVHQNESTKNMSPTDTTVVDPFMDLYIKCKERRERMGELIFATKGRYTTMTPKPDHIKLKEKAAREEELNFQNTEYMVQKLDESDINKQLAKKSHGMQVSFKTPFYKRAAKRPLKTVVQKKLKGHSRATHTAVNLLKIVKERDLILEVVDKRKQANFATFRKYGDTYGMHLVLNHMVKKRRRVDITMNALMSEIATICAIPFEKLNTSHLKEGHSGLVLQTKTVPNVCTNKSQFTVVRGTLTDAGVPILVDARKTLTGKDLMRIREFSAGDLFWKGYNQTFVDNKPSNLNHQCTSDLNVTQCGAVMALLTLALFPCGKITCKKCVENFINQNNDERFNNASTFINQAINLLDRNFPEFKHSKEILLMFRERLQMKNPGADQCMEINKSISALTEAPFTHIKEINSVLLKYGSLSNEEVGSASKHLLEVARYVRNRTDSIQRNDLSKFRNKISSKTHINLDLMCDNQLDKNANFVWGQRAYHAKRFLSNYFNEIDPSEGYDKFIFRKLPNGTRELATGRLIVPTNFESFRDQMKGKVIDNGPISKDCVSRMRGAFCYPCCCTTDDVGTAILSDFKMPTKYHLVLGGNDSAKYIELPSDSTGKMYIAKDGFCHINIFFAMLVNVSEERSKDFTKMVRDQIMPKLGEWPTMMDVATACWYLTVWFPDTLSAELPRILVDHKLGIMHVLDSYGSISAGYHVLKANIVSQLIKFASDDLESDLKFYRVGGNQSVGSRIMKDTKLLIKSIYKPQLMEHIIEQEPFLLVLAMQSPATLLALFNSSSLEKAVQYWLHRDMQVSHVMTLLAVLASNVSASKLLTTQFEVIEASAPQMLAAMDHVFKPMHSINSANTFLMNLEESRETDKTIDELGFYSFKKSCRILMEKTLMADLDQQWQELGSLEKLSLIKRSWQVRAKYSSFAIQRDEKGIKDRFTTSLRLSGAQIKQQVSAQKDQVVKFAEKRVERAKKFIAKQSISLVKMCLPRLNEIVNVLAVVALLNAIIAHILDHIKRFNEYRRLTQETTEYKHLEDLGKLYRKYWDSEKPTYFEFEEEVKENLPSALETFKKYYSQDDKYTFQAKPNDMVALEKVVAVTALILMIFDAERSDCVYKVLNKLKGILSTTSQDAYKFQSLDTSNTLLEDKKMTIDFEVDEGEMKAYAGTQTTFSEWWDNQLQNGNVVTHYRTEGHFMEFTRANAQLVANEIAHNAMQDILVRGAVGSGKSTGFPFHLSNKGKVLMIESTKPLAENVFKQLKSEPFFANPTLRMRGTTSYGASPITIMTSGYALHYYANNPAMMKEYKFVIIDECHVHDANAIAFVSLLKEYSFDGKLIKVSATPPGREVEFTTQHPVTLVVEESLSFEQFVSQQGTGANCDMLDVCDNILVYVASYNEVDQLSKMLLERGHIVTKVDGRTMKNGKTGIETKGSKSKRHFIVATNIIENGVTLDIEGVVDFGLKVVPELDVDNRIMRYTKQSVSYGERIQRLGRVGRHKAGKALRIGITEKGLVKPPSIITTEAAFYCFAYGLPVMAEGVSPSLLSKCTVQQARSMMSFELPIMYTVNLVRFDGTMHPVVHNLLKPYKLRDSNIVLNKMAIPHGNVRNWPSVRDFKYVGVRIDLPEEVRVPFHARDIPDKLHKEIYDACCKYKGDAGFSKLNVVNACKIAYTLQTDPSSIQRTIKILDELIAREQQKREYFQNVANTSCAGSSYSLANIVNAIRARSTSDYTQENLSVLHSARQQLLEFKNINSDFSNLSSLSEFGALECLQFESLQGVSKHLQLKGHWNKPVLVQDFLIAAGIFGGGCWMLYQYFKQETSKDFVFQGKNKRSRQKLRFRDARDMKGRMEVYADEGTIVENFGSKYAKKGKTKGTTVGMGTKTRRFTNMYGFDPTEYSFARYLDPITGETLDEQPITNLNIVSEHFLDMRKKYIENDIMDSQHFQSNPKIEGYFVKDAGQKIMKIDLTPHRPLLYSEKFGNIMGYPEREGEMRQTGVAHLVDPSELPKSKESKDFDFESISKIGGLRDYNPISSNVCLLQNESADFCDEIFGIGFGNVIITNQHLFRHNNGELTIQSKHGTFKCRNTCTLKLLPVEGHDLLLIQMPKDFPVFPQKLRFREPTHEDKIVLVSTNFQEKSFSSVVSESSNISRVRQANFYKHWISTVAGQCGNPMVSVKDGFIVGIHSLTSCAGDVNVFTSIPPNFETDILRQLSKKNWCSGWKLNTAQIGWDGITIVDNQPKEPFPVSKMVGLLNDLQLGFQSSRNTRWLMEKAHGNIKVVAQAPSALVTKHVVKGKCSLFEVYLTTDEEAEKYFRPLMGAYQKSRLNKEAYIKDLMKYATPIEIGLVDTRCFERGFEKVQIMLRERGFDKCNYITYGPDILNALNMKAAMGALYSGKKKDHFEGMSEEQFEHVLQASCERLYNNKMGVWNGSLKAELRPQGKGLLNKTRSFTAAPIDTLLAGKVCVDDFNNKFYSLHLKIPSTVGITKFYGGWDRLLESLPDGWIYCDADGSQFDSSLTPYLINAVLDMRLSFMEDWDLGEQMLKNLYTEIVYTPILTPDGTIVKKFKGNNSGQPSTVVDNTLMVIMAVYYAAEKLGIKGKLQDTLVFFANGDDLLIAIKPECEAYLDKFGDLFSELGLKYDFSSRTREKGDLWFMSHRGVKINDMWIPKLEEERIVSILEWDRALQPEHRLEAICASMIEAWGYPTLLNHIRKFYLWVLSQAPYNQLSADGKAPYISEVALKHLYTEEKVTPAELEQYSMVLVESVESEEDDMMLCCFQSGQEKLNAGEVKERKDKKVENPPGTEAGESSNKQIVQDRDVNTGTVGTFSVPRLKKIAGKLNIPKIGGKIVLNLDHLLDYNPPQDDISNTIATQEQFEAWYNGVKQSYEVDDSQMSIILNGLMVWCIENGTSGDLQGEWTMMDGEEQVTYPLKPILDNAKPTFRQIMSHFSQVAEAYIEKRNATERYMPRYGLQRNLTDYGLARYAFDFYRLTSKTPVRAREAHMQMKAAAIRGRSNRLFGLDGNVGTDEENTERHTAGDVNRDMHTMLGVRI